MGLCGVMLGIGIPLYSLCRFMIRVEQWRKSYLSGHVCSGRSLLLAAWTEHDEMTSVKKNSPWLRYWFASTIEFWPYPLILGFELYTVLVFIMMPLDMIGLSASVIGVVSGVLFLFFSVVQTWVLYAIRNTSGYLMYLARVAKDQCDPKVSSRIQYLRWFLHGVNRIGNLETGRHFQDLVLKKLRGIDPYTPSSLTIDQIIAAIELKVVDAASQKEAKCIYKAFANALEGNPFGRDTFTVSNLSDFLVGRYVLVSPEMKERVRVAYQKRRRLSSENFEWVKLVWIPIIVAIITAVASIISA